MQKLYAIQAARGVAALMVVAFHSLSIEGKYLQDSLLPKFLILGQTGVDLFFVISGFVMVLATQHHKKTLTTTLSFLKGRVLRIYPTYWAYYFLLLIVMQISPGIINSSQGGEIDLLSSFFLIPNDKLPILMVAWTLTHEMWFYLVFSMLLLIGSRTRFLTLAAWLFGIVIVSLYGVSETNPWVRVATHEFTLEFIFGAFAAYVFNIVKSTRKTTVVAAWSLAGSTLLLVIAAAWVLTKGEEVLQTHPLARSVILGVGFSALALAISLFEQRMTTERKTIFSKSLKVLGDMSYSLYLSHILSLSICGRLWRYFEISYPDLLSSGYLFWLVTYSVVLLGGYLAYICIERPILRMSMRREIKNDTASQPKVI